MLLKMVSLNSTVSCVTTAIWLRRSDVRTSLISVSPIRIRPVCGS